jgi:hypothetical protein
MTTTRSWSPASIVGALFFVGLAASTAPAASAQGAAAPAGIVGADVFNALNVNTVTSRIVRSGATYLLTAEPGGSASGSILLPRILQIGASFSF